MISSPGTIDEHASSQIGVTKSIGFGLDSESDSSVTKSGINTKNITITDEQGQQVLTGQSAEQTKDAIYTTTTTDSAKENSGALKNNFDKDKVQSEINLQVSVTQQFDANRQEAKQEINKKIDDAKQQNLEVLEKEKNHQALTDQEKEQLKAYYQTVENYQQLGLVLDTVAAGLSAPTNSALGMGAAALSPTASYEIGQYFKGKDAEGSTAHILAHTLLGAAVAAAGGNDALTAGLSAGGAEASAPILAQYLYGKKPSDLTADEKGTISSITGLVASGIGASTGDIGSTVQGGQVAQNAVDNNEMSLPLQLSEWGKGAQSLTQNAHDKNYSNEEILKALDSYTRGTLPDNADIIEHGGKAWLEFMANAVPIPGGYKIYQGTKWVYLTTKQVKDWNQLTTILYTASKGKGNFGLGTATAEQAAVMGKAWVGSGYRVASDGKTLVSADGLRIYRPPVVKKSSFATTGVQANFEQLQPVMRMINNKKVWKNQVISNGHLDVMK